MRAFIHNVSRREAVAKAAALLDASSALAQFAQRVPQVPFPPNDAFDLSVWTRPDEKLKLREAELVLRAMAAASGPITFEISGNREFVRMGLRGHKDDEHIVRHTIHGFLPNCFLQSEENQWWRSNDFSLLYECAPVSPFERITMPLTLPDSLLWPFVQHLLSIEEAVGFYQCVFESFGPTDALHREIEKRHDIAFLNNLVAPDAAFLRTPMQLPSGELRRSVDDLIKKTDGDVAHFRVRIRYGIIGTPAALVPTPRFLDAIRCRGQALQLVPVSVPMESDREAFFRCGAGSRWNLLLSSSELSTLVHILPAREDIVKRTCWPVYHSEIPASLVSVTGASIGTTELAGRTVPISIPTALRNRSIEMIAGPGHGKTNVMKHVCVEDVKAGNAVIFIDPHGDAVKDLLLLIPTEMRERIVYLNPGCVSWIACWNPLAVREGTDLTRVADDFVSTIKRNSLNSWGPQVEIILRQLFIGLLHLPNPTFQDAYNLLRRKSPQSEAIRLQIIACCRDPIARQFWEIDFLKTYSDDDTKSSRNRILRLVSGGSVSQMLAQRNNRIDINEIMASGKILLVDLSEVGEECRRFLGSFLLSLVVNAGKARAAQVRASRKPVSVFCDEAHLFTGDTIESLITEMRKFNLWCFFAHQLKSQFTRSQMDALMNAGTILAGRADRDDAAFLAKQFQTKVDADEIAALQPYHFVGKIGNDIVRFRAPPNNDRDDPTTLAALIEQSHKRYYLPAHNVASDVRAPAVERHPKPDLSYDEF